MDQQELKQLEKLLGKYYAMQMKLGEGCAAQVAILLQRWVASDKEDLAPEVKS